MMLNTNIVRFIAEECRRQNSGYASVGNMAEAWEDLMEMVDEGYNFLSEAWRVEVLIKNLIKSVEPNHQNWRTVPVSFANGNVIGAEHIHRQIHTLCEDIKVAFGYCEEEHMTAQEAYEEFERIHPFADGNGRVGKILFNYLNGTLENPVFPEEPDFSSNTTARMRRVYGAMEDDCRRNGYCGKTFEDGRCWCDLLDREENDD